MTDDSAAKIASNRQWVLAKLRQEPAIDCSGCGGKCCYDRAIFLYPEAGDDPILYDTVDAFDGYFGRWGKMLRHKPAANGRTACVYLADDGLCSIHLRRPASCRSWSCVAQASLLSRADEHTLKRKGLWKPEHEEGKRRLWLIRNGQRTPTS